MMASIERDYYPLPLAASLIGCSADDLIHLAANGKIRLGVILFVDGFETERYKWYGPNDEEKVVKGFCGFAYVDQGYFLHLERSGEFAFNAATLPDGDTILMPFGDIIVHPLDKIFMHRNDLLPMIKSDGIPLSTTDAPFPTSRAHVSNKLAKMNQASAKFWSNADRDDRGTHPENAKVAAWLVQQGFSPTLADKAATIIRPDWAPSGRKPEE